MLDVVIKNGAVIDGTGKIAFKTDVGIKDGKIAVLGEVPDSPAAATIEAGGLVVAPGFIDMHSHGDLAPFSLEMSPAKIRQGVTTEVVGQCGLGTVPFITGQMGSWKKYVTPIVGDPSGADWDWPAMENFFQALERQGLANNFSVFLSHGAVRAREMGLKNRDPSAAELRSMEQTVSQAMEQGAWGMSAGLAYLPGSSASAAELVTLYKVVAEYDGLMMVHIRSHSRDLEQALAEAASISEQSGVKLHISHLRSYPKPGFGRDAAWLLNHLDRLRARGLDVTFDEHPYAAGSTLLTQILPPWAKAGGTEEILLRLNDPRLVAKLKKDLEDPETTCPGWDNFLALVGWENILVASVKTAKNRPFQGKTITQTAEILNLEPADTAVQLLKDEQGSAGMVMLNLFSEEDIAGLLKHPLGYLGSDGIPTGTPHPRLFGTFPRYLGKYVREQKVLPLPRAIHQITQASALRLGIKDRGVIRKGYRADLAVFDPQRIADRENYAEPNQKPLGMMHVLVNGIPVLANGEETGRLPGKVLKKQ